MDGLYLEVVLLFFLLIPLISAIFIRYRWYSFIKLHGHRSVLFAVRFRIVLMLVYLSWVGNYNGFDLILLNVFLGHVLGIGVWCFPCVAVVFVSFCRITCYLSCLINRDIWRGIFAALAVVSAGYLNFCFFFSVSAGVLFPCCIS